MNEELQKNLSKILEYLEQGGALIAKETPLLIQEILTYYTYYYGIIVLVSVLVLTAWLLYLPRGIRIVNEAKETDNGGDAVVPMILMIAGGIGSFFPLLSIIFTTGDFIKVLLAPRLFLLEKVTGLLSRVVN